MAAVRAGEAGGGGDVHGGRVTPIPSFPQIQSTDLGEGECRVFMNMLITTMCDVLEGRLLSARGRLVRAVMSTVGG